MPAEKRLTDYAAERAAGTLPDEPGSKAPKVVEKVDIKGEFTSFDGKPGKTDEKWPHFRGTDYSNIVKSKVPLAKSWPEGGPPQTLGEVDLGEGYAGAAVWKGVFYISDYDDKKTRGCPACFLNHRR